MPSYYRDKMKEHHVQWYFLPTLICLLLLSQPRIGVVGDYCETIDECHSTHNGSALRFTDSNPQLEISVERGKYLNPSMSCQAEGFTHIRWLKDERIEFPFDFTFGGSRCHLSLRDCNQTVQITNTQKEAIGNYTCLVSNEQHTIHRTFTVYVQDEKFDRDPFTIGHANCSNNAVRPGEDVYLFCEFCAGDKSHVTDVRWHRVDGEGNLVPISQLTDGEDEGQYRESENIYTRDCLETYNLPAAVGRSLIIKDITPKSFGSYVLTANYTLNGVDKAGSQKVTISRSPDMIIEITVGVVASLFFIFIIVTMVTTLCYMYNLHLTLQLYWKNRFGRIEEHDGMKHDAFISFSDSPADERFAIAIAELLLRHDYNIWMREMHAIPGQALIAEEIVSMKQSRRCILIISSDYPTSSHSQILTDLAADQTLRMQSRIIPMLYGDVSREHWKQHPRLAEIVRVCPCITWKEMEDNGSSEMHSDSISGWGPPDVPNDNISGSVTQEVPSINGGGSGSEEMPCNGIQPLSGDGPGCESVVCERNQQSANGGSNHGDVELTVNGHCNGDMRIAPRDGDQNQLIEDDQDEQEKKKKLKLKKKWEKNEKRLLLKMPPKRVVASPAGITASTVV